MTKITRKETKSADAGVQYILGQIYLIMENMAHTTMQLRAGKTLLLPLINAQLHYFKHLEEILGLPDDTINIDTPSGKVWARMSSIAKQLTEDDAVSKKMHEDWLEAEGNSEKDY